MSWSLNEIESLAKKAARGAGMSWGLAEEAGKATRWLCAAKLPGADLLAQLLTLNDGVAYGVLCPSDDQTVWHAKEGPLCPLITGAAVCDRAAGLAAGQVIELQRVSYPLLLVPFVAAAADMTGATLSVSWPGVTMTRGQGETYALYPTTKDLTAPTAGNAVIRLTSDTPGMNVKRAYRCHIASNVAECLTRLAHRTYAPDTPESRLAGAGAGLTDND